MLPLVIGHRGAAGEAHENTLRSFELALRQGAQMIELDLHLTRDGHPVVIHDPRLDHTTDRRGRISQLTLEEVRRADAGAGERVPTLVETLELVKGRARLYLEIKDPQAAPETIRIVRAAGMTRDALLASFNLDLMRRVGDEVRDIEIGLILGIESLVPRLRFREAFPWLALAGMNYQVLSLEARICPRYLVSRVKAQGRRVFVWTVNEERGFARMIARGVDGIVTDYPGRLAVFLRDLRPSSGNGILQ